MASIDISRITKYVEENIGNFHEKRLKALDKLNLDIILKR